jgi:hypothetical protein
VPALTVSGRLRTLLTVPTETPARPATSRMLVVSGPPEVVVEAAS